MQSAELSAGRTYALREHPRDLEAPLIKVTYLGLKRHGKVKIRWEQGDLAGLEDWVPTRLVLALWGARRAYLKEERSKADLERVSAQAWDPVVEDAINAVIAASGDCSGFVRTWWDEVERLQRLWRRAGLDDPMNEPHAFVDRWGKGHLSFQTALKWAQAFSAAEPEVVGLYLSEEEDKMRARGWEPGQRYWHQALRESSAAHALVRDWAAEPERHALEREVKRLRSLVEKAIGELEQTGAVAAAKRLQRGLGGQ